MRLIVQNGTRRNAGTDVRSVTSPDEKKKKRHTDADPFVERL